MVSVADPNAVVLACEVAVMIALAGSPSAVAGAVYRPAEVMEPPFGVVTAQVTAVLVEFVTVAVNCVVCGVLAGQLA